MNDFRPATEPTPSETTPSDIMPSETPSSESTSTETAATETSLTEMAQPDVNATETTPVEPVENSEPLATPVSEAEVSEAASAASDTALELQPLAGEATPEEPEVTAEFAPETADAGTEPEPVTIDAPATLEPAAEVEASDVDAELDSVSAETETTAADAETAAVETEPVALEPQPVAFEPATIEPETATVESAPEPEAEVTAVEPETVALEAETTAAEAEAVALEPATFEPIEPETAAVEAAPEPQAEPQPEPWPEVDITQVDALEIARRVRARQISPVAVIEAHLAAIERANPAVNAVCTLAADHALEAARRLEAELAAGRQVGPLAGVPVGIKDLTATAGIRTTYASTLYADNVPTEDALVVQRLKAAGCIVIGKTNTSEFGAGANTFNAVFGATRNPWNTALSASGSTGGGAAGLRSGMFALAEGSDFGGSLRTPAAFCGVVGLRPSPGLVPRHPSTTPWDILSVTGPMARSVTDLAAMLQAISGPSPYSPLMVPVAGRDFVAAARAGTKRGLRVAYCADASKVGVDTEIEQICRAAAFALQEAGALVEEIDLDLSAGRAAFLQLRAQAQLSRHLHHLGKLDKLGQNLAGNIRLGLAQSPRDIALGEHGQAQIFHAFRRFFENYDCLITPCTAVPPFPVERNYPETINGQAMKSYIEWVAPTFVVTLAGLPALSVPCGFTAANLPVGLQIVGPRWGEELTLGVGKSVEDSHPVGFPSLGSA